MDTDVVCTGDGMQQGGGCGAHLRIVKADIKTSEYWAHDNWVGPPGREIPGPYRQFQSCYFKCPQCRVCTLLYKRTIL